MTRPPRPRLPRPPKPDWLDPFQKRVLVQALAAFVLFASAAMTGLATEDTSRILWAAWTGSFALFGMIPVCMLSRLLDRAFLAAEQRKLAYRQERYAAALLQHAQYSAQTANAEEGALSLPATQSTQPTATPVSSDALTECRRLLDRLDNGKELYVRMKATEHGLFAPQVGLSALMSIEAMSDVPLEIFGLLALQPKVRIRAHAVDATIRVIQKD